MVLGDKMFFQQSGIVKIEIFQQILSYILRMRYLRYVFLFF